MSINNSINLDNILKRALNDLKQENRNGLYDLNKRWENTARKLLNVAYDWNLKRLELESTGKKNYPGIDLGDSERMIGVQVSSRNKTKKINEMLSKLNNEVDGVPVSAIYNTVYLFVIGYRLDKYDEKKFNVPANVRFDKSHVLDFNSLKEKFDELDDDRQKKILDILETDIVKHPAYKLNSEIINFCNFVPNSRKTEMKLIDEAFKKNKNVFLWGLGGIGKTELAVEWAKEKKAQGEDVYLIHYTDNIIDTVCNLAFSNYEFNDDDEDAEDIVEGKSDAERKAEKFREKLDILREQYSNAIIIIDNFDKESPDVSWADMLGQEGYSDLVGLKTRFLFTTRFEVKVAAVYVPEMNLDDLLVLFKQNAQKTLSIEEEIKAVELIKLVDMHTLSVDLMSTSLYMSYGQITIDSLIKSFKENALDNRPLPQIKAHHNSQVSDYEYRELRVLGHLKMLFEMSNLNKMQLDVMCHAYLLPESGIDIQVFYQCQTDAENEVLTQSLIRRRWLRINQEHTHLSMHPVIRQVCHEELKPTDDNCSLFLNSLIATVKPINNQNDSKPVYDTIIQAAHTLEDQTGKWHFESGKWYRFIGSYETAKDYLEAAIRHYSLNKSENPEELVTMLHETALIFDRLNEYENAIDNYQISLNLLKNLDNEVSCARIYHDLGNSYGHFAEEKKDIELFKKSLEYLNKALDINRANPQSVNPLYISHGLHAIGNIYSKMGKMRGVKGGPDQQSLYKQALESHLEALEIRNEIFCDDPYNIILARSYNAIGNDYANLNDNEKALENRKIALEYFQRNLLKNHPDIAKVHSNVAHSYYELKKYPCAIEHYIIAESIYKANLPQERISYAKCKYRLLEAYCKRSKGTQTEDLQIARKYGEEALELSIKLNDNHLLSDVQRVLAEVYGKLGDRKRQQNLLVSRMESTSSKLEVSEHRHLAEIAWKNGELCIAKKQFMLAYEYYTNNTPKAHNNIAYTLYQLGLISQKEKNYDQSLNFLQQAKEHYLKSGDVLSDKVIQKKVKTIKKTMEQVSNSKRKNQ